MMGFVIKLVVEAGVSIVLMFMAGRLFARAEFGMAGQGYRNGGIALSVLWLLFCTLFLFTLRGWVLPSPLAPCNPADQLLSYAPDTSQCYTAGTGPFAWIEANLRWLNENAVFIVGVILALCGLGGLTAGKARPF